MKISIIIPNYNGASLLEENFSSVLEAVQFYIKDPKNTAEIIYIDDASTDTSIDILNSNKLKVKDKNIAIVIMQNKKNIGFSFTINRAVAASIGEILVLLNTDVIPEKEFLKPLLSHFTDEKVFAVGCMDKSIEGAKTILRGRGIGRWQRGFLMHQRGEVNKTVTLWVNGGSGAFRRSIWDTLGGFNTFYSPFYWEDIDISYRAIKSGYKVIFEPKSIVIHKHEKGAIKKAYSTFQVKIIAYRNQFIFVWLNITDLHLQLSHVLWLPYHILKAIIRGDRAFLVAFLKALCLLPGIVLSHFKNKKIFKKNDKEIVSAYYE